MQMLTADAIAAMKPNSVFINLGRGNCVDEQALIQGEYFELDVLSGTMTPAMPSRLLPPLEHAGVQAIFYFLVINNKASKTSK